MIPHTIILACVMRKRGRPGTEAKLKGCIHMHHMYVCQVSVEVAHLALMRGGYLTVLTPCLSHSLFTLSLTFLHNSNTLSGEHMHNVCLHVHCTCMCVFERLRAHSSLIQITHLQPETTTLSEQAENLHFHYCKTSE